MTVDDLVSAVMDLPSVKQLPQDNRPKREMLERLAPRAANEVTTRHDWDFAVDRAEFSTVAEQEEYELRGNADDCRDVINVVYDDDVLNRLRAVDVDEWLTGRTITTVVVWYISGRSANGYPNITFVDAPSSVKTVKYRYRKNNIGINEFPDEFFSVLRNWLAAQIFPTYHERYEKELKIMIDRYKAPGGEDNPAPLDRLYVRRNNDRFSKYGY